MFQKTRINGVEISNTSIGLSNFALKKANSGSPTIYNEMFSQY